MQNSNQKFAEDSDCKDRSLTPTDAELLMRFTRNRDERAFRRLVEKHASLVMGVCRQVLRCDADIDDAFQATFIVLSNRADSIKTADSLASWLYKVAYRTAWHAAKLRVKRKEAPLSEEVVTEDDVALRQIHEQECHKILHEELKRLPERYQAPIILFHLQDRSREETANELELTDATVKARLARGRKMLRLRLARRGIGVSAAMGTAALFCQSAHASTRTVELVERCCAGIVDSNSTMAFSEGSSLLAKQEIQRMIVSSASRPLLSFGVVAATVTLMLFSWSGVSSARQDKSEDKGAFVQVSATDSTASPEGFVATLAPSTESNEVSISAKLEDRSRKVRPGDVIAVWVGNSLPDSPIRGRYRVESTGQIALGPGYGRVKVDGVNIEGAEELIEAHLAQYFQEPQVIATHDHLPGEAEATSRPIPSADDPLMPGELLRIRVGQAGGVVFDEIVEIESDSKLPFGFLFTRLNTGSKSLSQLEDEIRTLLEAKKMIKYPGVLITRISRNHASTSGYSLKESSQK